MDMRKGLEILGPILIILLISPFLFTRPSLLPELDFSNTGEIGDTIGGLTAPIIGIISIVLLYCTLQSQNDFNKRQEDDNKISHIISIQNEIISLGSRLEYSFCKSCSGHPTEEIVRSYGISSLLNYDVDEVRYFKLNQIKSLLFDLKSFSYICRSAGMLLSYISDSEFNKVFISESRRMIEVYLGQVKNFYDVIGGENIKLYPHALEIQQDKDGESECSEVKKMIQCQKQEVAEILKEMVV